MSLAGWLAALAAGSGLMMAVLAATDGKRRPAVVPLAFLGVNEFAWNAARVGVELGGGEPYFWVGHVAAPLAAPLLLHVLLVLVGKRRALAKVLLAAYVLFVSKSLISVVEIFVPGTLPGGLTTHRILMLCLVAPTCLFGLVLAWRNLAGATSRDERWRAQLVLAAVVVVMVLFPTDWLHGLREKWPLLANVPPVANVGSLFLNFIFAYLVLGVDVVSGPARPAFFQAGLVSLFVVALYLVVFFKVRDGKGVMLLSAFALTLALFALLWEVVRRLVKERERMELAELAVRPTQQMAHDLNSSLGSAFGELEELVVRMERSNHSEFRDDVKEALAALKKVRAKIDAYRRKSSIKPDLRPVELVGLARQVAGGHRFETSMVTATVRADSDLIVSALENLVLNSVQANAKDIVVRVTEEDRFVVVAVVDDGEGMDAATLDQVGVYGHTTKPQGSGMGLSFVVRLMRAHGGTVTVRSKRGSGTTFEVRFRKDESNG